MILRFVFICLCLLTGACAVGVQHRYDAADAKIETTTNETVAVAVEDARPYVLTGEKAPNFVGLSRAGFGNPYDVTTTTDQPLAHDMTKSIVSALKENGISAAAVLVPPNSSPEVVHSQLLNSRAGRLVWVVLEEWKADTYANTTLLYDVTVRVLDGSGRERGSKQISGNDNLGGSFANPPAHSRVALPKAFNAKIEELFNDPKIAAALK